MYLQIYIFLMIIQIIHWLHHSRRVKAYTDFIYRDNLAKDVQSRYIRGPSLKQHNFNSKTYANNSKQHIHDRNTSPEHKNVNLMV